MSISLEEAKNITVHKFSNFVLSLSTKIWFSALSLSTPVRSTPSLLLCFYPHFAICIPGSCTIETLCKEPVHNFPLGRVGYYHRSKWINFDVRQDEEGLCNTACTDAGLTALAGCWDNSYPCAWGTHTHTHTQHLVWWKPLSCGIACAEK